MPDASTAASPAGSTAPAVAEKLLHVSDSRVLDAEGNPGVYTGTILPAAGGLPHGEHGVFCYIGAVTQTPIHAYEGSWHRGQWHGFGKCVMRNGDVYEGMHEYGQRQGTGTYTWKTTGKDVKYVPNLASANASGDAAAAAPATVRTVTPTDGPANDPAAQLSSQPRVYHGDFVQNQRHGQGIYRWGNLSYYKGTFLHGQRQGHGVYVHHGQQLEYVGQWNNGKYHGQGVLTYPCRRCVATDVNTNQKQTLLATYKGTWAMGQRHGYGIETFGDGTVRHDGMWNHDTPLIVRNANAHREAQPPASASVSADSGKNSTHPQTRTVQKASTDATVPPSTVAADRHAAHAVGTTNSSSAKEVKASSSHSNDTVVVNQERCRDARGFYGLYRGILFNGLPQGVGTMDYTAATASTTSSGSAVVKGSSGSNAAMDQCHANNPVAEYEGFWEDGKFHGFGRMLMMNGDKYAGNFDHNQRHGPDGEYWYADGRHYKGDWANGLRHGSGRFLYPKTGDLYQGEFVNGQRQGYGKFTFGRDGTSYKGNWFQGQYHGHGTLISEKGDVYTGEFQHGKFHGQGRHVDSKGAVIFDGRFVNGMTLSEYNRKQEQEQQKGILSKMADVVLSPATLAARNKVTISKLAGSNSSDSNDAANSLPFAPFSSSDTQSAVASTTATPSLHQRPSVADFGGGQSTSSLLSSLSVPNIFGTTATGSSSESTDVKTRKQDRVESDQDTRSAYDADCKAVVDQLVWDGQNNAGRYTGILHLPTQRPHGVGRMVYKDGNRIFEGFWVKGHRQGHGRCMFVQMGDFHEGQYHANLRHGPGKYIWKDGRRFVGEYRNDERHGPGKFWYPNGDFYEGMFEHGQRSGEGTFTFGPSCVYRGSWSRGTYNGFGTLQWTQTTRTSVSALMARSKQSDITTVATTKHKYVGEFENGVFHGHGTEYESFIVGTSDKQIIEKEKVVRKGIWDSGSYVGAVNDDDDDDDDLVGVDANDNEQKHKQSGEVDVTADSNGAILQNATEEAPMSPDSTDEDWEKVGQKESNTETPPATATGKPVSKPGSCRASLPRPMSAESLPQLDRVVGGDPATEERGGDEAGANVPRSLSRRSLSAPPSTAQSEECCSGEEQTYEAGRDEWRSSLDMGE